TKIPAVLHQEIVDLLQSDAIRTAKPITSEKGENANETAAEKILSEIVPKAIEIAKEQYAFILPTLERYNIFYRRKQTRERNTKFTELVNKYVKQLIEQNPNISEAVKKEAFEIFTIANPVIKAPRIRPNDNFQTINGDSSEKTTFVLNGNDNNIKINSSVIPKGAKKGEKGYIIKIHDSKIVIEMENGDLKPLNMFYITVIQDDIFLQWYNNLSTSSNEIIFNVRNNKFQRLSKFWPTVKNSVLNFLGNIRRKKDFVPKDIDYVRFESYDNKNIKIDIDTYYKIPEGSKIRISKHEHTGEIIISAITPNGIEQKLEDTDIGIGKGNFVDYFGQKEDILNIQIIPSKDKLDAAFHAVANSLSGLFKTLAGLMAGDVFGQTTLSKITIGLFAFAAISYATSLSSGVFKKYMDKNGIKDLQNVGLVSNIVGLSLFALTYLINLLHPLNNAAFVGPIVPAALFIGLGAVILASTSKAIVSQYSQNKESDSSKLQNYKLRGSAIPATFGVLSAILLASIFATLNSTGIDVAEAIKDFYGDALNNLDADTIDNIVGSRILSFGVFGSVLTMLIWSTKTLIKSVKANYKNKYSDTDQRVKIKTTGENTKENKKEIDAKKTKLTHLLAFTALWGAIFGVGAQITGDVVASKVLKDFFTSFDPANMPEFWKTFFADAGAFSGLLTLVILSLPSMWTSSYLGKLLKNKRYTTDEMNPVWLGIGIAAYSAMIFGGVSPWIMLPALFVGSLGLSNVQTGYMNAVETKLAKETLKKQGKPINKRNIDDAKSENASIIATWNGFVKGLVPVTMALAAIVSSKLFVPGDKPTDLGNSKIILNQYYFIVPLILISLALLLNYKPWFEAWRNYEKRRTDVDEEGKKKYEEGEKRDKRREEKNEKDDYYKTRKQSIDNILKKYSDKAAPAQ
ncbi:MAG: hypothetical protein LBG46_03315, partial [Elusimicrobiota bacterium]|nr:hypothetical protein [Elusimicrobiota bacterium]